MFFEKPDISKKIQGNKVKNRIRINELEIGESDSRTEREKKGEANFYYFDGLKFYEKFKNNKNYFIICGRKGFGKSALASRYHIDCLNQKILSKFAENSSLLSKLLSEIEIDYKSDKDLLVCFYKYVILIEISKMLSEVNIFKYIKCFIVHPIHLINCMKIQSDLKKIVLNSDKDISTFKIDYYKKINCNETNQRSGFNTNKKYLTQIECENILKNNKTDEIMFSRNEFYNKIDILLDKLIKINKILNFNIVFDDIEDNRIFNQQNDISFELIKEFILTIKELNSKFSNNNSRIIIVIRDDILELINSSSNNINKVIEDHSIKINWITGYNEKTDIPPLIELVLSKIINNNFALNQMKAKELYNKLLPKQIDEIPINNYIINATFGRPRDIIMMFKKAASIPNENEESFSEDAFRLSREIYSEYFCNEIRNELSLILKNNNDVNNLFLIFKNINKKYFQKNDVAESFKNLRFEYFKTVNDFLDFCFDKSIIGIVEENNKKKTYFKWKYRNNQLLNVNSLDTRYVLHFGISKSIIGK